MARNHCFRIKVSLDEKQIIENCARASGFMSGASFLRHLGMKHDFYEKFNRMQGKMESSGSA